MSDRPWMPLDIEDYLSDTHHLSAAEHGAYMLLIMRYWKDGGLPADERLIMRQTRLSPEQWTESRDVLAAFFEDGWRHKRIDTELAKATDIIGKRRAAAEAKHKRSKPDASAEQVQSTSTDTGVPPVTKNPPSSLRSDGDARRGTNPIIVLQSEVDAASAQRWVTHLEDKGKKPSTAQAEELCGVLRQVKAAGGNPAEALRFAIKKGWVSLELEYLRNNGFPLPKTAPAVVSEAVAQWPLEKWRLMVTNWQQTGDWNPSLGPKPGEPGCRVPPELLKDAA
jgi:uncharacterized protein YdaU (DUF1376 family)